MRGKVAMPVIAVFTILMVLAAAIFINETVNYNSTALRVVNDSERFTKAEIVSALDKAEDKIRWSPLWYNRNLTKLEYSDDFLDKAIDNEESEKKIVVRAEYSEVDVTKPDEVIDKNEEYYWTLQQNENNEWEVLNGIFS